MTTPMTEWTAHRAEPRSYKRGVEFVQHDIPDVNAAVGSSPPARQRP